MVRERLKMEKKGLFPCADETDSKNLALLVEIVGKGPLHQEARQRVRLSHMKHESYFVDFTDAELVKFVVLKYTASRNRMKRFCVSYYVQVVCSITTKYGRNTAVSRRIKEIVSNLDKIYNTTNPDKTFFDTDGRMYDTTRFCGGAKDHPVFIGTHVSDKMYSEVEMTVLVEYYQNVLDNYLTEVSKTRPPQIHEELALLITILAATPRRVGEVLKLNRSQVDDLIARSEASIKSKRGTGVSSLIVPQKISNTLQQYMDCVERFNGREAMLFTNTYKRFYTLYRNNFRTIFKREPNLRVFHGFRNYFAGMHMKEDPSATREALAHTSIRTTYGYAKNQLRQESSAGVRKLLDKHNNNNNPFTSSSSSTFA